MKFYFVKKLSIFWNIMEYSVWENWKLKINNYLVECWRTWYFNYDIEMVFSLPSNTEEKMVGFDG
jgi:hypothetical protein